ncbi:MAG: DUF1003 domain-containing protein [Methylovulum sp.]|nr:DUF1003 domain-containing protein [Methylovulum sp.]
MSKFLKSPRKCAVCGKSFPQREVVPSEAVRDNISQLILRDHPDWSTEAFICLPDLSRYNANYVESLIESERGELSTLEKEVIDSLRQHELLAMNVDVESEKMWSFGEKLSDRMSAFAGSWIFLVGFGLFMAAWIIMNSLVLYWQPIDPFPYILLNLLLSCLAAIQAPIIMMSQKRQEAKDRLRSQHDYQVNLKAELEIRHLNEKLDHLISHQWERLVQIQQVQIQMLSQLEKR